MSVPLCKVMKEIVLTKGKVALVDNDDFEMVSKKKWRFIERKDGTGYASRTEGKVGERFEWYMHWEIIGKPSNGLVVDHINRNKLDNRKENLRVITHRENLRNTDRAFSGAYRTKGKKYFSMIGSKGKYIYLGTFDSKEDATKKYREAEKNIYGVEGI